MPSHLNCFFFLRTVSRKKIDKDAIQYRFILSTRNVNGSNENG